MEKCDWCPREATWELTIEGTILRGTAEHDVMLRHFVCDGCLPEVEANEVIDERRRLGRPKKATTVREHMTTQHTFVVTVTIKHDAREFAKAELSERLNKWFNEKPQPHGYQDGTLLHFSIQEDK